MLETVDGTARCDNKPSNIWYVVQLNSRRGNGIAPSHEEDPGDMYMMIHVEDVLVDQVPPLLLCGGCRVNAIGRIK